MAVLASPQGIIFIFIFFYTNIKQVDDEYFKDVYVSFENTDTLLIN